MKIAIIGAAGVRTPLIVQAMLKRQEKLRLHELTLMDIDAERLELIGALTLSIERSSKASFSITHTTDPVQALRDADFVITTFRVGGIESRVIDERVPLNHGMLGQETTGAGGFAMGLRSIPVLLDYVMMMHELCPHAWLINFANPAGMLTEAVIRHGNWSKVVGICDGPTSMHGLISAILKAAPQDVYLDYFGLNHLGWIKRIIFQNKDYLPDLITMIQSLGIVPGLPFDAQFIAGLGMIPNEYCYYYYYTSQAIDNILKGGECRGEQVARENLVLYSGLAEKLKQDDLEGMQALYQGYLDRRGSTYMLKETGKSHDFSLLDPGVLASINDEGYAGVALNLIEALIGDQAVVQILNVPNKGAISCLEDSDVVEIPTLVCRDHIQPLAVSDVPAQCIGLMQQVKHYEHLTIQAAVEKSYHKALTALALHPLVRNFPTAKSILDEYIRQHGHYFHTLK